MKVCIVTLYNSVNSGSFWQAYVLSRFVEQLDNEVYFVERSIPGSSAAFSSKAIPVIKALLKFNFKKAKLRCNSFKGFETLQKKFSVISKEDAKKDDIDYYILGSDTIWNLDSSYFRNNYRDYFGMDFPPEKIIVYGASAANSSLERLKSDKELLNNIDRWKFIGLRDVHTINALKDVTDKKTEFVCDPTLLFDKKDYEKLSVRPKESGYIFLYLFQLLSEKQKDELQKFANEKNLKIISGVEYRGQCDKIICNTPQMFLNYIFYSDYVITDTFHGTVFSVNLNKRFVCINRNKKKVNDFLLSAELSDRMEGKQSLSQILNEEIDYNKNNSHMKIIKDKSKDFLTKSLS